MPTAAASQVQLRGRARQRGVATNTTRVTRFLAGAVTGLWARVKRKDILRQSLSTLDRVHDCTTARTLKGCACLVLLVG